MLLQGLEMLVQGSHTLPLLPLPEHYLLRQEHFATKQPNLAAVISGGKEHNTAVNTSTTFQAPGLPKPMLHLHTGAQVSCLALQGVGSMEMPSRPRWTSPLSKDPRTPPHSSATPQSGSHFSSHYFSLLSASSCLH